MKKRRKKRAKHNTTDNAVLNSIDMTLSQSADSSVARFERSKPQNISKLTKDGLSQLSETHSESEEDGEMNINALNHENDSDTVFSSENGPEDVIDGRDYPFDLWVVLSLYIKPESVSTFARLSKNAYHASVIRTSFWLNLYNYSVQLSKTSMITKGYRSLPEKLQEEYVNRYCRGNLRVHVIRSLFCTYPPFKERLSSQRMAQDPHKVLGKICLGLWTIKKANIYRICLRVSDTIPNASSTTSKDIEVPDSWCDISTEETDLSVSHEECHHLLQFECDSFNPLKAGICGFRILEFNVTSSGDGFRYQKCSMLFGPTHYRPTRNSRGILPIMSDNAVNLTLGNITSMQLLQWFHPLFYC